MKPNFNNLSLGQMLKLRLKWMFAGILFFFLKLGIIVLVLAVAVFLYFLPAIFPPDKPVAAKPKPPAVKQHKPKPANQIESDSRRQAAVIAPFFRHQ